MRKQECMKTPITKQTEILAELWIEYKNDTGFEDFISYNDLGLPLAYAISADIVSASERANLFIEETFGLLLEALSLEDEGFESLDDLISLGGGLDE